MICSMVCKSDFFTNAHVTSANQQGSLTGVIMSHVGDGLRMRVLASYFSAGLSMGMACSSPPLLMPHRLQLITMNADYVDYLCRRGSFLSSLWLPWRLCPSCSGLTWTLFYCRFLFRFLPYVVCFPVLIWRVSLNIRLCSVLFIHVMFRFLSFMFRYAS